MITIRLLAFDEARTAATLVARAFTLRRGVLPPQYRADRVSFRQRDSTRARTPERFLVAVDDHEMVGIGGYAKSTASPIAWDLVLCAVDPDRQRQGIGRALISARLDAIRARTGEAVVSVATRQPERFAPFGFQLAPLPPSSAGAWWMVAYFPPADGGADAGQAEVCRA